MIFFAVVFRKFCKKSRSSHQTCSKENIIVKKAVLNKFCNIYKKTPVPESLFDKVVGLQACSFVKKETPTQMLFCEYEIFKNTYFEIHLRMTASVNFKAAVFQESLALPFK